MAIDNKITDSQIIKARVQFLLDGKDPETQGSVINGTDRMYKSMLLVDEYNYQLCTDKQATEHMKYVAKNYLGSPK